MSEHAPQLDARDLEPDGIWPWVVAIAAGILLVIALGERLSAIPDSLERQTRASAVSANAGDIDIGLDGRDVTLAGEIGPDIDRGDLVRRIRAIDGVRIVRDELLVIDPATRQRESRAAFRDALAGVDVSRVAFQAGSAELSAGSDDALEALVQLMRERPGHRIRVAGHTDSQGRAAVNLELSRDRAGAVAAYLIGRGVDRSRVLAQGYGATQPVAENGTAAGRARNRRIEISYID